MPLVVETTAERVVAPADILPALVGEVIGNGLPEPYVVLLELDELVELVEPDVFAELPVFAAEVFA